MNICKVMFLKMYMYMYNLSSCKRVSYKNFIPKTQSTCPYSKGTVLNIIVDFCVNSLSIEIPVPVNITWLQIEISLIAWCFTYSPLPFHYCQIPFWYVGPFPKLIIPVVHFWWSLIVTSCYFRHICAGWQGNFGVHMPRILTTCGGIVMTN